MGDERTEPNLIHFKWGSRVNRHSLIFNAIFNIAKKEFQQQVKCLRIFPNHNLEVLKASRYSEADTCGTALVG